MKTIAVTIDEPTLDRLDRVIEHGHPPWRNRSEVVRQAVRELLNRVETLVEEEREREIFRRNAARINRQAAELVKEQARP